jgi:CHAT domain-containing protein
MAFPPRAALWPSLAACLLIATLGWGLSCFDRAQAAEPSPTARAWALHFQGKTLQARRALEAHLASPAGQAPGERLIVLEQLLDICIRTQADACLQKYAPAYAQVAGERPFANEIQKIEAARRAGYYLFAAQGAAASDAQVSDILANPNWKLEHAYDVELYLRRQVLAANLHLRAGRKAEANRAVDKILSLIASLENPGAAPSTVVWALSEMMETLAALGDTERAYGIFRATVGGVGAILPPQSLEAALFELRAGLILLEVGRPDDARRYLDLAVATLHQAELEADVQRHLLAVTLTAKAQACNAAVAPCAAETLARHPFKDLYASPGRTPQNWAEVEYLSSRALTAAVAQAPDPVVAEALQRPLAFTSDPSERAALKVHQALGRALASPPGEGRWVALREAGAQIRTLARQDNDAPFGAWYQSGAFDQAVLRFAVAQAETYKGEDGADIVFTLLQLVDRRGQTFDSDALSLLGRARDPLERRAVHQALRLRVRRDALEREKLQSMASRLGGGAAVGQAKVDHGVRMQFRDYAVRIGQASTGLAKAGLPVSGTNLASLKDLRSALAPDEAALLLAPAVGDALVYMCVRRDTTMRRVIRTDLKPLRGDMRLIQAALTAGHPPSEALDSQFPVASAARLYDVFIRPFEPCLKPGDHILWLPGLSLSGFPLAALLDQAPPKLERGYDLAQAGWLARRHAVTYAGSASVVVASRAGPRPPPAQLDFLGVGDPEFAGATPTGEDRAKLAMRGVRAGAGFSTLPPLPDTEDELRRSAKGFRSARLLLDGEASEGGFRKELSGAYRYLSFATHGLIRDDLQGLSEPALALTPVSGATAFDDGLLTAPEIADLNLSARFVALSACNTANFDLDRMAQDLPALASAFAVAGVPATLGTLWPVDSKTGEQVVAGAFERLQAGHGGAYALAEAQRAFLDKPPSRAHLHPRFWTPFVILGDGGAPLVVEPAAGALKLNSVEPSTKPPGTFRVGLGPGQLIGETVREGTLVPTLRLVDARSGDVAKRWRSPGAASSDAAIAAGAQLHDGRAVFAISSLVRPDSIGSAKPRLSVYLVDASLEPRRLFEMETPGDFPVRAVTLTSVGGRLLVTYASLTEWAEKQISIYQDDFDRAVCLDQLQTRVELRDLSTGAPTAQTTLEGHLINVAVVDASGGILLGGSAHPACGQQGGATVIAMDKDLKARTLYLDASPGASDVRTLAPLPDGQVFVAASKDNTVEFRPPSTTPAPATEADVARALHGGMLIVLGSDGRGSEPLLIDAGTTLFIDSADASRPDEILMGVRLADRSAVLRLSAAQVR